MKSLMKKLPPVLLAVPLLSSCFAPSVCIDDLPDSRALTVGLDANAHSTFPGRRLKFWVDIVNNTSSHVELKNLKIRLNIVPARDHHTIALTKRWTFEWRQNVDLPPTKKITVPIEQEITGFRAGATGTILGKERYRLYASEFPIEQLRPGQYRVLAVVNDRFQSPGYDLKVLAPRIQNNPRVRTPQSRSTRVPVGPRGS